MSITIFRTVFFLLPIVAYSKVALAVDFSVSVSQWQSDYSGDIGQSPNVVTYEELGFDEETSDIITAVLRHPIPLLPNVKFQRTELDTTAQGTLTQPFTFDGTTYQPNEQLNTSLDLSHTDMTVFWSPVSNWVTLDVGITGRNFDGDVSIEASISGLEAIDFDGWVPMLYLGARFELPLTGWYLDLAGNAINAGDDELNDLAVAIGYANDDWGVDVITELGMRKFTLDVRDIDDIDGLNTNLTIDGLYLAFGLRF